jgi:hypothetical protein
LSRLLPLPPPLLPLLLRALLVLLLPSGLSVVVRDSLVPLAVFREPLARSRMITTLSASKCMTLSLAQIQRGGDFGDDFVGVQVVVHFVYDSFSSSGHRFAFRIPHVMLMWSFVPQILAIVT